MVITKQMPDNRLNKQGERLMNKTEALKLIIESICDNCDDDAVVSVCSTINSSKTSCVGISCCDCPFNSANNLTELSVELDAIKGDKS